MPSSSDLSLADSTPPASLAGGSASAHEVQPSKSADAEPSTRSPGLCLLPEDILQEVVVPFLSLREFLKLRQTCKALQVLDPRPPKYVVDFKATINDDTTIKDLSLYRHPDPTASPSNDESGPEGGSSARSAASSARRFSNSVRIADDAAIALELCRWAIFLNWHKERDLLGGLPCWKSDDGATVSAYRDIAAGPGALVLDVGSGKVCPAISHDRLGQFLVRHRCGYDGTVKKNFAEENFVIAYCEAGRFTYSDFLLTHVGKFDEDDGTKWDVEETCFSVLFRLFPEAAAACLRHSTLPIAEVLNFVITTGGCLKISSRWCKNFVAAGG